MNLLYYKSQVPVRMAGTPDEPLWAVKDVCQIIGIRNWNDAISRLDDDEKGVGIADTLGGQQDMVFCNESGLYHLIFMSRKPEAKAFRKWVFSKVLPSIRKYGYYRVGMEQLPPEAMSLPEIRREGVIQRLELCLAIAASKRRIYAAQEIAAKHKGIRGFTIPSLYRMFSRWENSGRDWKTLDLYRGCFKYNTPARPVLTDCNPPAEPA